MAGQNEVPVLRFNVSHLALALVITLLVLSVIIKVWRVQHEAAHRQSHINRLKQITLACHNYHETFKRFPKDVPSKRGPVMSYRANLLPYMSSEGGRKLYLDGFYDGSPWNSRRNLALAAQSWEGRDFQCEYCRQRGDESAHFLAITGPGTIHPPQRWIGIKDITDGLSETIMFVEVKRRDIHWAQPRDLTLAEALKGKFFFDRGDGKTHFAMADGHVHLLDTKQPRAAYLIADGDPQPLRLNGKPWPPRD